MAIRDSYTFVHTHVNGRNSAIIHQLIMEKMNLMIKKHSSDLYFRETFNKPETFLATLNCANRNEQNTYSFRVLTCVFADIAYCV